MIKTTVTKNDFKDLAFKLPIKMSTVVDRAADLVKRDAQAASPQQLGIDRQWRVLKRGPFRRIVQNGRFQAVFYENGTPFLPSVPMLRPALERGRRPLEALVAKALDGR